MLSSKTELELAMDRHRRVQDEKEKRKQKLPKNEFQRKLSEISGRLTEVNGMGLNYKQGPRKFILSKTTDSYQRLSNQCEIVTDTIV